MLRSLKIDIYVFSTDNDIMYFVNTKFPGKNIYTYKIEDSKHSHNDNSSHLKMHCKILMSQDYMCANKQKNQTEGNINFKHALYAIENCSETFLHSVVKYYSLNSKASEEI